MAKDPRIDTGSRARHMPAEAPIKLRFDKFASFVSEYSSKLSLGGVFLKTDQLRPAGSEVSFDFRLVDGFRLFHGQGEVVWVRTTDNGPDRPKGVGVRFAALDDKGRELVLKILEEQVKAGGAPFEVDRVPADATVDWRPAPEPAAPAPAAPATTPQATAPQATGFALMSSIDFAEEPTLISARRKGGAEVGFDAPWGERLPEVPTDLLEEGAEAPVNVPPVSSPDFARPEAAPRRSDTTSGLFSAAFPDQLSKTSSPAHLGFMLDDAPEDGVESARSVGPWDATQPVPTPDFAATAKTAAWAFDPTADDSRLPSTEDPLVDLEEPFPLELEDLSEEPTMVGARRSALAVDEDEEAFAFDPPADDGDLELQLPEPIAEAAAAFKTGAIPAPIPTASRKTSPWEVADEPPPWKTAAIPLPAPAAPLMGSASSEEENANSRDVAPFEPEPFEPAAFEPEAFDSATPESFTFEPVTFEPAPFEPAPFEPEPFEPVPFEPTKLETPPTPAITWNPPPAVSPAAMAQAAMPVTGDAYPPLAATGVDSTSRANTPAFDRPSVAPAQYGAAAAWSFANDQPTAVESQAPHAGLFGQDEPWIPEDEPPSPTLRQRLTAKPALGLLAGLAILAGAAYFLAPTYLNPDTPAAPISARPEPPAVREPAVPVVRTTHPAASRAETPEPEVVKVDAPPAPDSDLDVEPATAGPPPIGLPPTERAPEPPIAEPATSTPPSSDVTGSAQYITAVSTAASGDQTELTISLDGDLASSQVSHDPMAWTNDREKIVLRGLVGNRVRSPASLRAAHVRSVRLGEHPGEIWVVIDKKVGSRVVATSVRAGSVVVTLGR
jgi:uncharacterized protein (TIGR02266 family)